MDLREAVQQITEAAHKAEDAARTAGKAADDARAAIDRVAFEQRLLRRDFEFLWTTVHGSHVKPPAPPPPGVDPADHELEHAAAPIAAQVKAAHQSASEARNENAELRGMLAAVQSELVKQSSAMGVGKTGLAWVFSSAGQKSLVRTLGGIAAIVAAVGAVSANFRAHPAPPAPAATSAAPAPTVIVLSAPPPSIPRDAGVAP